MSNEILPFCATDIGTNLLTQVEYNAATNRTEGNQPGLASSKLNNKALRQSSYVASQVAQYLADITGTSILDDNTPAKLLAQLNAALKRIAPVVTVYSSSSGTHNLTYTFFIASGSATAAATYTNNAITYTVVATVASGLIIQMTGSGAPTASGTLTKASGTGDATLTFYAVRAPIALDVELVGGGGGGAGSGAGLGAGGTGGTTSFGTTLLSAIGGTGGATGGTGGAGGTASLGTGPLGDALSGGSGCSSGANVSGGSGGSGGASAFGGAGLGPLGANVTAGGAGKTNSGGGGGGASTTGGSGGGGGGAGGYVKAYISSLLSTYAYAVGAAGAAGAGAATGGAGGSGHIVVRESYQ